MVWSRFSAWSNTIDDGRLEDVVGHLEGAPMLACRYVWRPISVLVLWSAGRQCMKLTFGLPVAWRTAAFTGTPAVGRFARPIRRATRHRGHTSWYKKSAALTASEDVSSARSGPGALT